MPLFRKKPPPQWYILRKNPTTTSSSAPTREGPYTRLAIVQMYATGNLPSTALLWTNERIFPDPEKPNKSKPIRIMEWRRMDQIPDPVFQQIDAAARDIISSNDSIHTPDTSSSSSPHLSHTPPPPPPPPQTTSAAGGGQGGLYVPHPVLNTDHSKPQQHMQQQPYPPQNQPVQFQPQPAPASFPPPPPSPSVYPAGTEAAGYPTNAPTPPPGYPGTQPAAYPR